MSRSDDRAILGAGSAGRVLDDPHGRPLSIPRLPEAAAFVVLGGLGTALMVNVAGILTGYGPVYAAMLYAVWRFKPKTAAVLFLGAELVALPFYLISSGLFASVAVTNVILRPLLVYLAARFNERTGSKLVGALTLTLAETLLALTIDVTIFQSDQAGFAIYGILLAPFIYVVVTSRERSGASKGLGLVGGTAALLAYYFAFYSFAAVLTGALSVLSLGVLYAAARTKVLRWNRLLSLAALLMLVVGFAGGGSALQYNLSASLYPLNPHSWTAVSRWEQTNPGVCPPTSNVFASTWSPSRLRIVSTCTTVVGTIGEQIDFNADGDFSFGLIVNGSSYSGLMSLADNTLEGGELHIEVVPADQHRVLDPLGGGVCPGDVARITGVLVIDTDHGMGSEIHPAMTITILQHASPNSAWPACVIGRSILLPGGFA
jgi:hypothetical protein